MLTIEGWHRIGRLLYKKEGRPQLSALRAARLTHSRKKINLSQIQSKASTLAGDERRLRVLPDAASSVAGEAIEGRLPEYADGASPARIAASAVGSTPLCDAGRRAVRKLRGAHRPVPSFRSEWRNLAGCHGIDEGRQSTPAAVILRIGGGLSVLGQLPKNGNPSSRVRLVAGPPSGSAGFLRDELPSYSLTELENSSGSETDLYGAFSVKRLF